MAAPFSRSYFLPSKDDQPPKEAFPAPNSQLIMAVHYAPLSQGTDTISITCFYQPALDEMYPTSCARNHGIKLELFPAWRACPIPPAGRSTKTRLTRPHASKLSVPLQPALSSARDLAEAPYKVPVTTSYIIWQLWAQLGVCDI
ncbi:uncharacterized protein PAC_17878 [Phialocephala subalpina]|uniref:Uncharacterized protein n=1 Tax=Phialocephala subalpina TaxID=576137 RepID=A0A1L7XSL0_9HELO|nr:uncharacterized protein PAC_17878 [Phialocephala subalpina]